MAANPPTLNTPAIKSKIHTVRGMQVMLDKDLAELYNVRTKALNQAVNRNIDRFPPNFMFQLSEEEFSNLRSQFVTSIRGGRTYLPYAFTEQGVAMLSGILKSETAVKVSIQIINTFVSMRKFISANAQIFHRLYTVEIRQIEHNKKLIEHESRFEEVFDAIQSKGLKPEKGIFFDGQIFDAYKFVSDIVRSASKSIILIDNYVDDSVLTLFSKRNKNVQVTIFTNRISEQLTLDLARYNSQYPPVFIKEFKQSHDRFLIIDNKYVYHAGKQQFSASQKSMLFCDFGASLKDLGKKWFAFSKFDKEAFKILERLGVR